MREWDRPDVDSASCEEPGNHGVRVPHLAEPELVATPDGHRDARHQVEQPLGRRLLGGEGHGALDSLAEVGDRATGPATDLVPKQTDASGRTCSDRADGHDPARPAVRACRRLLDDKGACGGIDLERGVIEVAPVTPAETGRDGLEQCSVHTDRVASGPERQPVELDARTGRCRHQRACPSRARSKKPTTRASYSLGRAW